MHGVLKRRLEQSGGNQQERLMLSREKMFAREKGNALWVLHDFWHARSLASGQIPLTEDFAYKEILPESVTRYISWADVTPSNPLNFIMHDHTRQTAFADHSDRRLGDHPVPMNAKACACEYIDCIRGKQPTYFEIDQSFGTISRHMVRLMVPVADSSGAVVKLVYAVRIINSSLDPDDAINSAAI